MVGRRVLLRVEKSPAQAGPVALAVRNLDLTDENGVSRLAGVSFEARSGEILGIAGVAGNGQSELLEVLAGIRPRQRRHGLPVGQAARNRSIANAANRRRVGIAHIPEDRQRARPGVGLLRVGEFLPRLPG